MRVRMCMCVFEPKQTSRSKRTQPTKSGANEQNRASPTKSAESNEQNQASPSKRDRQAQTNEQNLSGENRRSQTAKRTESVQANRKNHIWDPLGSYGSIWDRSYRIMCVYTQSGIFFMYLGPFGAVWGRLGLHSTNTHNQVPNRFVYMMTVCKHISLSYKHIHTCNISCIHVLDSVFGGSWSSFIFR